MNTITYSSISDKPFLCKDKGFIDLILLWADKHITRPIQGFEQKRDSYGRKMTYHELLGQTHEQVLRAACYFYNRGKSLQEILQILTFFKK